MCNGQERVSYRGKAAADTHALLRPEEGGTISSAPVCEQALRVLLHLVAGDLEGHHLLLNTGQARGHDSTGGQACLQLAW